MQQNVIGVVGVTLPVGKPAVAAPQVPVAPLSEYFMDIVPTDDVQAKGAALVAVGAPLHVVLLHKLTVGEVHATPDTAQLHAEHPRESFAPP